MGTHGLEESAVVFKIPGTHQSHGMKIRCKNMSVFVNRSVLNGGMGLGRHLLVLAVPRIQKIDLQVEGPTLHVLIEIVEVGVVINLFKMRFPAIMTGQHFGEGGLSGSDIPGNGDVLAHGRRIYPKTP